MLTVHKFDIRPEEDFAIMLPESFKVVSVASQPQGPVLYVLVETDGIRVERRFSVFGTGRRIPALAATGLEPLGTFGVYHSPFADEPPTNLYFHVFGPRTGGSFSGVR